MSDPWPSQPATTSTVTLTLAVEVTDAVTGKRLRDVDVSLAEFDVDPVRNPSGYHCFLDLPASTSEVTVQVDGGQRYQDAGETVVFSDLDPDAPSKHIPLSPAPAYEFPSGATVIRGRVEAGTGDPGTGSPLADVPVSVVSGDASTMTDEDGEFVFAFDTEDITGGVVQVDGGSPTVQADYAPQGTKSKTVHLPEGETEFIVLQYSPVP